MRKLFGFPLVILVLILFILFYSVAWSFAQSPFTNAQTIGSPKKPIKALGQLEADSGVYSKGLPVVTQGDSNQVFSTPAMAASLSMPGNNANAALQKQSLNSLLNSYYINGFSPLYNSGTHFFNDHEGRVFFLGNKTYLLIWNEDTLGFEVSTAGRLMYRICTDSFGATANWSAPAVWFDSTGLDPLNLGGGNFIGVIAVFYRLYDPIGKTNLYYVRTSTDNGLSWTNTQLTDIPTGYAPFGRVQYLKSKKYVMTFYGSGGVMLDTSSDMLHWGFWEYAYGGTSGVPGGSCSEAFLVTDGVNCVIESRNDSALTNTGVFAPVQFASTDTGKTWINQGESNIFYQFGNNGLRGVSPSGIYNPTDSVVMFAIPQRNVSNEPGGCGSSSDNVIIYDNTLLAAIHDPQSWQMDALLPRPFGGHEVYNTDQNFTGYCDMVFTQPGVIFGIATDAYYNPTPPPVGTGAATGMYGSLFTFDIRKVTSLVNNTPANIGDNYLVRNGRTGNSEYRNLDVWRYDPTPLPGFPYGKVYTTVPASARWVWPFNGNNMEAPWDILIRDDSGRLTSVPFTTNYGVLYYPLGGRPYVNSNPTLSSLSLLYGLKFGNDTLYSPSGSQVVLQSTNNNTYTVFEVAGSKNGASPLFGELRIAYGGVGTEKYYYDITPGGVNVDTLNNGLAALPSTLSVFGIQNSAYIYVNTIGRNVIFPQTGGVQITGNLSAAQLQMLSAVNGSGTDSPVVYNYPSKFLRKMNPFSESAISLNYISASNTLTSTAPAVVMHNDITAQTAAATITSVVSASTATTYLIGGYVNVTSVTSDTLNLVVTYTDENSNAVTQSFYLMPSLSAGMGAVGNYSFAPFCIHTKAATAITLKTMLPASQGSITYDAGGFISQQY